jgi:quinol monooxygenase YgiN
MTTSLTAEFTVLPGCESRVRELVLELTDRVRDEPGNLLFMPYVLENDPLHYFVFEVYADEEAFRAHLAADYGRRFNAELADLVVGGASRLTILDAVESDETGDLSSGVESDVLQG